MSTTEYDWPVDIEGFEDLLRQSISWAKSLGILIRPGSFGINWYAHGRWHVAEDDWPQGICPLDTVILYRQPRVSVIYKALPMATGVSLQACVGFYCGFDRLVYDQYHHNYYALGQKFRVEYEQGLFA